MEPKTFKETVDALRPHVITLVGMSKGEKAIKDISRSIAVALMENNVSVEEYILAYNRDEIFDPECLINNVNSWHNYVNQALLGFCKSLYELRPVGLGTPNAATGEGELLCLCTTPRIKLVKKKNEGELLLDDSIKIELKGEQFRVWGKCTGKELQKHAHTIAEKYGIKPNNCSKSEGVTRTAYEPWDNSISMNKSTHWINQFHAIGEDKAKEFLYELMNKTASFELKDFDSCFIDGEFQASALQKLIVKTFFKCDTNKKWDSFTVISDSGPIRYIENNSVEFSKLVDSGEILAGGSYFRSFQDSNVGWYVDLNFSTSSIITTVDDNTVTQPNSIQSPKQLLFNFV